jgi:hypothetical protein
MKVLVNLHHESLVDDLIIGDLGSVWTILPLQTQQSRREESIVRLW